MSLYIGGKRIKQVYVMKNDGTAASCIPQNIKTDVLIYGVEGNFTADGTQSAGQTIATEGDLVEGKSAWVNGEEIKGNLVVNSYYVGSDAPSVGLGINGDIYLRK